MSAKKILCTFSAGAMLAATAVSAFAERDDRDQRRGDPRRVMAQRPAVVERQVIHERSRTVVREPAYRAAAPRTYRSEPVYHRQRVRVEPAYRPAPVYAPAPVYRERAYYPAPVYAPAPVYSEPAYYPAPVYSEPAYYPAPVYSEPAYYPEPVYRQDNTAIGAIGGAILGAVIGSQVSHDPGRGAVIGAGAGAVLGGIIGSR